MANNMAVLVPLALTQFAIATWFLTIGVALIYVVRAYVFGRVFARIAPLMTMIGIFLTAAGFSRLFEALSLFFPTFWPMFMSLVVAAVAGAGVWWHMIVRRSDLLIAVGAERRDV